MCARCRVVFLRPCAGAGRRVATALQCEETSISVSEIVSSSAFGAIGRPCFEGWVPERAYIRLATLGSAPLTHADGRPRRESRPTQGQGCYTCTHTHMHIPLFEAVVAEEPGSFIAAHFAHDTRKLPATCDGGERHRPCEFHSAEHLHRAFRRGPGRAWVHAGGRATHSGWMSWPASPHPLCLVDTRPLCTDASVAPSPESLRTVCKGQSRAKSRWLCRLLCSVGLPEQGPYNISECRPILGQIEPNLVVRFRFGQIRAGAWAALGRSSHMWEHFDTSRPTLVRQI